VHSFGSATIEHAACLYAGSDQHIMSMLLTVLARAPIWMLRSPRTNSGKQLNTMRWHADKNRIMKNGLRQTNLRSLHSTGDAADTRLYKMDAQHNSRVARKVWSCRDALMQPRTAAALSVASRNTLPQGTHCLWAVYVSALRLVGRVARFDKDDVHGNVLHYPASIDENPVKRAANLLLWMLEGHLERTQRQQQRRVFPLHPTRAGCPSTRCGTI
jgi:hypothetical protein